MREFFGSAYRFVLVGALATVVHIVAFLVLRRNTGWSPTVATVLAFVVAFGVSYSLNHRWTFGMVGRHRRHLPRFLVVACTGAALNAAIMHTTTQWLGYSQYLGLVLVVMIVPAVSFLGNRYWGFR